jgi:hypothetical protein
MFRSLLCVALMLFGSLTYGGDDSRKGTTGADQLLIPVGARSIATAGAFLASTSGVEAIYYNPAGLAASQRSEALFSYMSYIADINISYFAVSAHLEDLGTFALSYKTLDFGKISVTTFEQPDGTGATYSPGFFTLGVSYARSITDRVTADRSADPDKRSQHGQRRANGGVYPRYRAVPDAELLRAESQL